MLNKKLIDEEFGFLKDVIFLNLSSVGMPPKRVQEAYKNFMEYYVQNFGIDIVSKSWQIVNDTREKILFKSHRYCTLFSLKKRMYSL